MFRKHLRSVLLIALGAAALTFSGTLFVSVLLDQRYDEARMAAGESLRYRQELLEVRMARLEEGQAEAGSRLLDLPVLETDVAAGEGSTSSGAGHSPFPLENIVRSIVELVCIDNSESGTYYTGSGTVIDASGLILTNSHILSSFDGTLIRFCGVGFTEDLHEPPVIEFVAAASAVHTENDLAVLQITEHLEGRKLPDSFPFISLARAGGSFVTPSLGETIFIGGYPGIGADTFTFTQGVVSGHVGSNLIKTSALIDSGTSGGAAFDSRGRYLGVPTAAVAGDIGGSLGYLISASVVDSFLKEYYEGGNKIEE